MIFWLLASPDPGQPDYSIGVTDSVIQVPLTMALPGQTLQTAKNRLSIGIFMKADILTSMESTMWTPLLHLGGHHGHDSTMSAPKACMLTGGRLNEMAGSAVVYSGMSQRPQ